MTPEVKQLKSQLGKMLNWNEARIDFLARLLIALVKVKTVNLAELAKAVISTGRVKISANPKIPQRI